MFIIRCGIPIDWRLGEEVKDFRIVLGSCESKQIYQHYDYVFFKPKSVIFYNSCLMISIVKYEKLIFFIFVFI